MLENYVQKAIALYEKADAILICDKNGFIEYTKWSNNRYFECKEVVGRHVLEVYPTLTDETSTIVRCLKTGQMRIGDEQNIDNFKGERIHIISTTYPIIVDGNVIGALCASTFCGRERENSKEIDDDDGVSLYELEDIITCNKAMIEIKDKIKNASQNNSTVLVYGETGTGKELVAESIHTSGMRSDQPFIAQNCASIPTTLLEGIFFGTEKGSYTGAENRKGLFELANKGTLFLDEINSMDFSIQAKLLKVLEEKRVRRLGGNKDINIDVKIICAMNENPYEAMKSGKIREDLYYRISVVQIKILPLRERREDISILADYFIKHFNKEMNRNIKGLSDLVKNAFENSKWYGNVRELRNTIESAFNNENNDIITMKSLSEFFFIEREEKTCIEKDLIEKPDFCLTDEVGEYEKKLILLALGKSKNMAEAAKKLKISRQNLKYKIEKYNI